MKPTFYSVGSARQFGILASSDKPHKSFSEISSDTSADRDIKFTANTLVCIDLKRK